jgi:hypothetical protein
MLLYVLICRAVLVAWRSRRTTAIRVLAPFLFLLLALVVNLALNANNALQERFVATPAAAPFSIGGIPSCHEDLHIDISKPCIDFVYSPNNDTTINVSSSACVCTCAAALPTAQQQLLVHRLAIQAQQSCN